MDDFRGKDLGCPIGDLNVVNVSFDAANVSAQSESSNFA